MSNYGKLLAQHLATELNLEIDDVMSALDNFSISEPVKKSPQTTSKKESTSNKSKDSSDGAKKPASKPKKTEENHLCCRIKRGQTDQCGKSAKKSIESNGKTFWYCGGDKTGCYSVALKTAVEKEIRTEVGKNDKTVAKKPAHSGKVKVGNLADRKAVADSKSESLIDKVVQQKKLTFKPLKTKSIGTVFYDIEHRYLADKTTQEIYGALGKDNDSIVELTDEQIRQLEGSGHIIKNKKAEVEATVESENSDDKDESLSDDESLSADDDESLSEDDDDENSDNED